MQYLTEQFWSRWKREYLHNIATCQFWNAPKRNFQVGDVDMDTDKLLPRSKWRLGRIIKTFISPDGLVRRVQVAFGDKKQQPSDYESNSTSLISHRQDHPGSPVVNSASSRDLLKNWCGHISQALLFLIVFESKWAFKALKPPGDSPDVSLCRQ